MRSGPLPPNLLDELSSHLPGILNWALIGRRRLYGRGRFTQPQSGAAKVREFDELGNPVRAFVADCCVVDPRESVEVSSLYAAYKGWCETNGLKDVKPLNVFGADLCNTVPELKRRRLSRTPGAARGWSYHGIRERTIHDPDTEDEGETNPYREYGGGRRGPSWS